MSEQRINRGIHWTEAHGELNRKMAAAARADSRTWPERIIGKIQTVLYVMRDGEPVKLIRGRRHYPRQALDHRIKRLTDKIPGARLYRQIRRYKQERKACMKFAGQLDAMIYELDPRPAEKLQTIGELLAALRVQLVDKPGCPVEDELARRRYVDGLQGIADELEVLLRAASNELGQSGRGKPERVRHLEEARKAMEARG